jgi:hypothetical protein
MLLLYIEPIEVHVIREFDAIIICDLTPSIYVIWNGPCVHLGVDWDTL